MCSSDLPIVSAIGDTINSAARLESMTKQFDATLVVSMDTLRHAGLAPPAGLSAQRVDVRGKAQQIDVVAIADLTGFLPAGLPERSGA